MNEKIINKKVIACDLDGTLAPSKSFLEKEMAEVIFKILEKYKLAVISGGSYKQFEKQFISQLSINKELFRNLYLFPTNGSTCYIYENDEFRKLYDEMMTIEERKKIFSAFKIAIEESKIDVSNPFGEIVEDREGEVTFSGRGQNAPLEEKEKWDPDQSKRKIIVDLLKKYIPEFEIRIGGATSIDITHKGINKAYAINKIKKIINVETEDILFIGDALYENGNDSSVKETGVECISVANPKETLDLLKSYL